MKHIRPILFAVGLLTLFCTIGCRPVSDVPPTPLTLLYRDTILTVGMQENEMLAALGDDFTLTEAQSCAGQGTDRLYTYSSVRLYVFAPEQGEARLSGVTCTDDGVQTEDGLRIGCTQADVMVVRGLPDEQTNTRMVYRQERTALIFTLRDGQVTGISLTQE